jgi:hypothetical protein
VVRRYAKPPKTHPKSRIPVRGEGGFVCSDARKLHIRNPESRGFHLPFFAAQDASGGIGPGKPLGFVSKCTKSFLFFYWKYCKYYTIHKVWIFYWKNS